MMNKNKLPVFPLLVLGLLCVAALWFFLRSPVAALGQAPQASYTLLDGSKLEAPQLQGKVKLINFWATSCTTCVAEMPMLMRTHQKYQAQGYETVAVAMQYDPPSYVVNFAKSRGLPFKVALDNDGALAKAWGNIQITPTTFLLDKSDKIIKRYVGAPPEAELHQAIEALL